ncbi:MAG: Fe-S cluster assembly protein SufD [Kitasatospora sp.]|jgi:Fe-S cluster assembly protein SufD|nr:Fe-S cluster assembly protein SufD [Kitasatospora sp.]
MAGIGRAPEGSAPVSRLHQLQSFDPADFPAPSRREEDGRFTPLRRMRGLVGDTPLAEGKVTVETDAAPGIVVEPAERGDARLGRSFTPGDRVSARAFASFGQATVITVPTETVATRPTVVTVRGDDAQGVSFGHLLVDVQPMAQAVVILDHAGSATYADNVELAVGDGASLQVVSLQDWADDAVHASHHHMRLGRDATVRHAAVSLGGDLVRLAPSVQYAGPGGDAELLGRYFADAGQHLEHRLLVDHAMPNCRSRVDYKGALQGQDAHAVWIGDVIIRAEATGTDTYERNRNLVLTDGTRVDSVPNLEILTGEVVGAGHASASGRLEDQHLFYLMARGIPEAEARRLVIRGFFGTLIDRIGIPQVAERVAAGIELELS